MVQVIKYGVLCNSEPFDDHMLSIGLFEKLIEVISTSGGKRNMVFCTVWSIFRDITSRNNPSLAIKICEKYYRRVNTIVLWELICPLMQIAGKWDASDPSIHHICIHSLTEKQEVTESERDTPFEFSDNSISLGNRKNLAKRKRTISYSKFERDKEDGFERSRKRFKSMADDEEEAGFVGLKKVKSFQLSLKKWSEGERDTQREGKNPFLKENKSLF